MQFLLDPLLDQRDLILVDNRGTGTSAPINCPQLQNGVTSPADFLASVGACGRQLGNDADRYGSGDVALDVEAVRKALGYATFNYFAASYGAVDAQAYAVRFPERLRSVVSDAGVPIADRAHSYLWDLWVGPAGRRIVELACRRAPACSATHPDPGSALARLAQELRRHPVDGVARDVDGALRRVHVDEVKLAAIVFGNGLNAGEIPAAAAALFAGDPRPLLRLAAESPTWPQGDGDPAEFSDGDNAAAFCNDADTVWNRTDSIPVRRAKYQHALAALPRAAFAPFSVHAITTFYPPDLCLYWPAPDRFTPAVPKGATAPGIPTLMLAGDLDTNVPTPVTERVRAVFPQAKFVVVRGAGHTPTGWSACARDIAAHFIRSLRPGSTGCANTPSYVGPAVAQFPVTASDATPASRRPGDASTRLDHQVATAAVRTVIDAWLRAFRTATPAGTIYGLRGGTVHFDWVTKPSAFVRLADARFAANVAVQGRSVLTRENILTMTLTVRGPGDADGRITATGKFGFAAPYEAVNVTGSLGGRAVRVAVPAN